MQNAELGLYIAVEDRVRRWISMTIKTMEQLNLEFMNERKTDSDAAKPAVNPVISIETAQVQVKAGTANEKARKSQEMPEKKPQAVPLWKELLFLVLKIAVILLIFAALFTFFFGLARYAEPSMYPAIKDGDLVIYHRYTKYGYLPQDTIILKHNGQIQARRVVATAGDVVDINEDGLAINGAMQQEMGIYQKTERYAEGVSFPLTVPEGFVFVLADSRSGATDSRIYGPVEIDDTLGKIMAVIRRRSI